MDPRIEPYETRGKGIAELISNLEHKSIILSVLRFFSFILFIVACVFCFIRNGLVFYIAAGFFLVAFVAFCIVHSKVSYNLKFASALYAVNTQYIYRMTGDFKGLYEMAIAGVNKADDKAYYSSVFTGEEFYDINHDYCPDLGLFGKRSLFSLLSVCETVMGRRRLAHKLLYDSTEDNPGASIPATQEACKELISDIDSVQEFQALAKLGYLKFSDEDIRTLFDNYKDRKKSFKPVYIILPILWLIPLVMIFVNAKLINVAVMGVLIVHLIFWGVGLFRNKDLIPSGTSIRKCKTLRELYLNLEAREFNADYLKRLVSCGLNGGGKVSDILGDLSTILNVSDLRSQPLFALVINLIFPLDYLVMDLMASWNKKHGSSINQILDNIGEIEALASISQITVTADEFVYPTFTSSLNPADNAFFEGESICHPLLDPETRVSNSVTLNSKIALIESQDSLVIFLLCPRSDPSAFNS